jgi:hypothetical protein
MSMTVVVYKWKDAAGPIPLEVGELLEEASGSADAEAVAVTLARLSGLDRFDPSELLTRLRRASGRPARWTPVDYAVHAAAGVSWVTMTGVPSGLPEACRALGLYFYTV